MKPEQAYIGRQPILDLQQRIIAHQLVFCDDSMVGETLRGALEGQAEPWQLGSRQVFVRVDPRDAGLQATLSRLAPAGTVFEITADAAADAAVMERCRELRAQGYRFALDGPIAEPGRMLASADYVRLDIATLDAAALAQALAPLRRLPLQLIACNVDSEEQFQICRQAGFHLLQGRYFLRPSTCPTKVINPAFAPVLELLNLVSRDADMGQIEAGFKRDPALSFKLLRYINSVGFGLSCEIQSIRHALTVIGIKQLYRWLTLLMVTAGDNSASPALMQTAVMRGRLAELLGSHYFDKAGRDNLFVIGAFSLLDSMLAMDMAHVLQKIDLPAAIHEALLTRSGIYGPFLALAEACESANMDCMRARAESLHLQPAQVNQHQLAAMTWAEELDL
jgi:EAL and modified HD-GYP domain-containing signal transduction protein